MEKLKICVKCKYYYDGQLGRYCKHSASNLTTDLITGKKEHTLCCIMRDKRSLCGNDGRYYEPKTTIITLIAKLFKAKEK